VLVEECVKLICLCDTHMQPRYSAISHASNAIRSDVVPHTFFTLLNMLRLY